MSSHSHPSVYKITTLIIPTKYDVIGVGQNQQEMILFKQKISTIPDRHPIDCRGRCRRWSWERSLRGRSQHHIPLNMLIMMMMMMMMVTTPYSLVHLDHVHHGGVTTPYSLGHVDVDDHRGKDDDDNSDDYEDVDLMPGGCVRAVTTLPSILVRARHKSSASKPAVFTTKSNLDVKRCHWQPTTLAGKSLCQFQTLEYQAIS